jgi:DNA repair exonuclease SbcCD ATPase subunit
VINKAALVESLRLRYPALEEVSNVLLRGVDTYEGRPYAIRYFDLSDEILSVASHLNEYLERIIGASFFDPTSKSDLRWNHYVYFLTSSDVSTDEARSKAKAVIETDREYARKLVLTLTELRAVLDGGLHEKGVPSLPPDPLAEWTKTLEKHDLGFVVDEALQVPAVVRHIAKGERQGLQRPPAAPALDEAERQVAKYSLKKLIIGQFRRYPVRKEYDLGTVNLITGVNGVGKTSLLEAIEYLFCGKVRRSDGAPTKASVTGVLANAGLEIVTKSTTPPAQLRARHLVWYGKADVRAVTLDDSFGKFNFLDTDAAVRLTVEQSQERINADIAQLLLGAEAAKTLGRFERVERGLLDTRRDLERDIEIRDQRRLDATARLQEMRSAPQESDQLFAELNQSLTRVGWTAPPSTKAGADSLSGALQTSLVNVGVLKTAGSGVPKDSKQLAVQREHIARAELLLKQISDRRRQLDAIEAEIKQRIRGIETRAKALDELIPMLDAGLNEIAKELDSKKQRITSMTAALAQAEPAARTLVGDEKLPGMSLRQAVEDQTREVEQRTSALNDSKRALDAFERTQAALTNLAQQLRNVARQMIEHTHDLNHCPLCGTQFERNDLDAHLRESVQSLEQGESQRMRLQVQESELAYQRAVTVLQALHALSLYQEAPNRRTTVHAILARVTTDRDELVGLQTEFDALRQRAQEHERRGWTLDRLGEMARYAALAPTDLNRESAEAVATSLKEQRAQYLTQLGEAANERQKLGDQVAQVGEENGVPSQEPGHVITAITDRARIIEQVSRAIAALARQLNRAAVPSELELEAHLREAHALCIRLLTAHAREKDVGDAIKREAQVLEDAIAEVAALRVQGARIDTARAVIADLIQKQSGQALTNQVLRENGAQIAAIFAKIHSPSEFDVEAGEDGLRISRRVTKTNVDLHEMSSGQRAAFTLSLFLAMNGRLKTGPRVIIFDDPVAHVDDINTLSFLDHLREIALVGERQLFFATADSKLAGLFARKFRFMGDQFKQVELTRE